MNKSITITTWIIVILVSILLVIGLLISDNNKSQNTATLERNPQITQQSTNQNNSTEEVLNDLMSYWQPTQAKFTVKAGESGTYMTPSKVQFISQDTLLVNYDDGLRDHTSILKYDSINFTEAKYVGAKSFVSQSEWQDIYKTYGNSNYTPVNYTVNSLFEGKSIEFPELTQVPENVFIR